MWLIYAFGAVLSALLVLAIYVNAYDDYDVSDRLRALGALARRAMRVLAFPLGLPLSALVDSPLRSAFQCGADAEPCAVFVDWNTHFAALIAQIALLRWLIVRRG